MQLSDAQSAEAASLVLLLLLHARECKARWKRETFKGMGYFLPCLNPAVSIGCAEDARSICLEAPISARGDPLESKTNGDLLCNLGQGQMHAELRPFRAQVKAWRLIW